MYSDSENDGQADARRIYLPQPAAAFSELWLPQTGAVVEVLYLTYSPGDENAEANESGEGSGGSAQAAGFSTVKTFPISEPPIANAH